MNSKPKFAIRLADLIEQIRYNIRHRSGVLAMKTALLSATLVMMMSWFDDGVDHSAFPELKLRLSVNNGQQFIVKPEIQLVRGQDAQISVVDRTGIVHHFVIQSALENGRTVVSLNETGGRWLMDIRKGNNRINYAAASGAPMQIAVDYRS